MCRFANGLLTAATARSGIQRQRAGDCRRERRESAVPAAPLPLAAAMWAVVQVPPPTRNCLSVPLDAVQCRWLPLDASTPVRCRTGDCIHPPFRRNALFRGNTGFSGCGGCRIANALLMQRPRERCDLWARFGAGHFVRFLSLCVLSSLRLPLRGAIGRGNVHLREVWRRRLGATEPPGRQVAEDGVEWRRRADVTSTA